MSNIKQILLNTISGWMAVVIRTAIALVMVPFLLSHLGKDGYGLVGLLGVIVSFSQIADLGLRQALGRELAEQAAKNDRLAFRELTSTALLLYFIISLVIALIGWVLAPWFADLFRVSDALKSDAIHLIRIYGTFSVILSFITPVFSSALTSNNRFDLVNAVQMGSGILSNLLLFLVIPFVGNALYGWAAVMLLYQAFLLVLMIHYFYRYCSEIRLGIKFVNRHRLGPLFHLGGYMYALQMTQALAERSDPLVISHFFGPAGVAVYQPGSKLSTMIRPVVLTLANQMYPLTTKQHVDNQLRKMQQILILGTKYTLLLGILFSVGMMFFAEPFCKLWLEKSLGEDYRIAAWVMIGWAFADLFTYAGGTQWSVMLGMKKLKFAAYTQMPLAIINLFISIILIGYTPLGIPGALIGTIVTGVVRRWLIAGYTVKCCGLSQRQYLSEAYLRPFICMLLTMGSALLFRTIFEMNAYMELAGIALLLCAVWLLSVVCVGTDRTERYALLNKLRNLRRR